MEGANFILAHKTDRHLFIVLTFSRKSKRPQWHHTEDFRQATTFRDEHEAEERQRLHRVPPSAAIPRDYATAHGDWMRAMDFPPEKRERQGEISLG